MVRTVSDYITLEGGTRLYLTDYQRLKMEYSVMRAEVEWLRSENLKLQLTDFVVKSNRLKLELKRLTSNGIHTKHNAQQARVWADLYDKEKGHALIVEMLRAYADIIDARTT